MANITHVSLNNFITETHHHIIHILNQELKFGQCFFEFFIYFFFFVLIYKYIFIYILYKQKLTFAFFNIIN